MADKTTEIVERAPIRASLLAAAVDVEAAAGTPGGHEALRGAVRAIEYHLDTFARQLPGDGREARIEPRLLHAAGDAEGQLRELLATCWEALREPPGAEGLRAIAGQMRDAAAKEYDLAFEALRDAAAVD